MPPPRLTPAQFRAALRKLGYRYIASTQLMADTRSAQPRHEAPVLDGRGRIDRAASLDALRRRRADQALAAAHAAAAAKAAEAGRQRLLDALAPSSLVPPRAAMGEDAAIRQMAEDFRNATCREGGITADDLEALGWTSAQIKTLAAPARLRAQALAEFA